MSTMLEVALRYAARGWHVFPTRITKAPYTAHGVKDATTDPEQISKWWAQWPNAGIGMACGAVSGVWALDVDTDKGGKLSLDDLVMAHGLMPDTLTSLTGGGGMHLLFKVPVGRRIRNSVSSIGAGLDCRGDGGYIILPPSRHESGQRYAWQVDDEQPIEDAPDWLLRAVTVAAAPSAGKDSDQALPSGVRNPKAYVAAALSKATSEIANAPPGTANNTLNSAAYGFQKFINAGWVSRQRVEDELFQAAEARGKSAREIRATLASALGNAREPIDAAPPTAVIEQSGEEAKAPADGAIVLPSGAPMALAERYLDSKRDAMGRLTIRRWRGCWWAYKDGHYSQLGKDELEGDLWAWLHRVFVPDKNREPKRLDPKTSTVDNVVRAMLGHGTIIPDDVDPPAHLGQGGAFRDLDTAVMTNGMLDLQTGQVTALSPYLFATSALGVPWPASPPYPPEPAEWLAFLGSIFPDDSGSVSLLQEWFGYCLTPDTSQQKMLWFLGPPRAGKGTVIRVLRALVGHKSVVDPQLSALQGPFGLQPWLDKTLAIIPDARLSGRADQDVIVENMLSITGEDHMTVQRKGIASVTCRIPARIVLLSNLAPRLSDSSGALASRILMLRVRKSFLGREDRNLSTRLMAELPGILGWAIEGWRRLRQRGRFEQPETSRAMLEDFASYGSPVASFVEDCCVVRDDQWVEKQELFDRWGRWCSDNGNEKGSLGNFTRNLVGAVPSVTSCARTSTRRARFDGISLDDS